MRYIGILMKISLTFVPKGLIDNNIIGSGDCFVENRCEAISLTHWGRDKTAAIFADGIFKSIFFNENYWISNKISLKYVPLGLIDNKPSLVQIMGCRRTGDNPLSELIME